MKQDSKYLDISDVLARKASERRQRAALGFAEKLDIVDALRARVEPLVRARKSRRAFQPSTGGAPRC
jgi:hypothetical protein